MIAPVYILIASVLALVVLAPKLPPLPRLKDWRQWLRFSTGDVLIILTLAAITLGFSVYVLRK
jgi:hypothetical protein